MHGLDDLDQGGFLEGAGAVARHVVGDVLEQLGEEGDLGELVEGDEAQRGERVWLDRWRWWAVGQSASGGLLDSKGLGRGWVREVVAELILELVTVGLGLGWEWWAGIGRSVGWRLVGWSARTFAVAPRVGVLVPAGGSGGDKGGGGQANEGGGCKLGKHYGITVCG